ncbi:MAG: AAA family ATPase [Oscillospiraceae bacterium]|nr:AAA family ATPase [Oscillospiraceae bacterium]
MRATFGKLEQAELTPQSGLNVIYAPNESGKSTWSRFIQNMLYGLNTRDKTELADKRRYAPWSGAAMRGRMDVTVNGSDYTILRETKRSNTPMGDFSCAFADTATAVPGITAQNAGEILLGVPREVFERSAFIGQAALSVDKSAELEKRIAALITTGEEDTSYSETYERLKKQLNRRKFNRSGQIPALERDIAQLDEALEQVEALQSQYRDTGEQVQLFQEQSAQLEAFRRQWDELSRREQWARYQAARQAEDEARQRVQMLSELSGNLPEERLLSRMENQCVLLCDAQSHLRQAKDTARLQGDLAQKADDAFRRHPLYPADENELRARLDHFRADAVPGPTLFRILLMVAAVALLGGIVLTATQQLIGAALAAGICLVAGIGGLRSMLQRRKVKRQAAEIQARRAALERQTEEYLPLRQRANEAANAAARASALHSAMEQQQQTAQDALLQEIRVYRPAIQDYAGAEAMVQDMRRQADTLDAARQALRDVEVLCAAMEQQLPEKPSGEVISPPSMSRAQVEAALPQAQVNLQSARSRLATLTGQLRAMGDPDDLFSRRTQLTEQRDRIQEEYDAIAMAMDALEQANLSLQNRFSPALGQRAAEIFSAITAGKYQKVLLDRDFALSAEPAGDSAARSIRLLSQGASDQLYLAVRLAICDMVLPGEDPAPLILDDALVSFDEERLHTALDYLLQEGKRRQILLFTCQKREQEYLAGRGGVTVLTL